MYNEEDSNKYIAPLLNKSDHYYQEFLEKKLKDDRLENQFWSVRLIEDNSFVGTINLNEFLDTGIVHIGCHLARKYWRKGFASETLNPILEHGYNQRNLTTIRAIIHPENSVSIQLFNKTNFKFEREIRTQESRLNIYQLKREEFKRKN